MSDTKTPSVWAVVLGYNNAGDTVECLHSILAGDLPGLKVLYVDNGSRPEERERVLREVAGCDVLALEPNAGVAGGLMGTLIGTVTPDTFKFFMAFYLLIIIVLGGLGSITGAVVTGFIFAGLFEALRVLDTATVEGMRMVFFAILLIGLMLFFRRGLFGEAEFSWDWLFRGSSKLGRK